MPASALPSVEPLATAIDLKLSSMNLHNARLRVAHFLDDWSWLLLLLTAPSILLPSPLSALPMFIVPGLWILSLLAGGFGLCRTPLNPALLLLALMIVVSMKVTFDLSVSLPKVIGLVLGLGIFFAFVQYGRSPRGFRISLGAFLLAGFAIALISLIGTEWDIKFDFLQRYAFQFAPRIVGLQGAESGIQPNEVAGAMLWVIPSSLLLSFIAFSRMRDSSVPTSRHRLPTGAVLVELTLFFLFVLLLTQSRGAYLSSLICAICLIPIWLSSKWRKIYFGGAVIAIISIEALIWRSGTESILNFVVENQTSVDPTNVVYTLTRRGDIWSRALYGIKQFPLTGIGLNTFRFQINALRDASADNPNNSQSPLIERDVGHAHNEFLQAALDLGIPGLIAFLALYWGAFKMLMEIYKQAAKQPEHKLKQTVSLLDRSSSIRLLALGFGGGLFAHFVYGLTDAVALGAKPGILFWMLLALIVCLYQRSRELQSSGALVDINPTIQSR